MARITSRLPYPLNLESSSELRWRPSTDIDLGALADPAGAARILQQLDLNIQSTPRVRVFIGTTRTQSFSPTSQDLNTTWENYASAIVIKVPTLSDLVIPGPNNASNTNRDSVEWYQWNPSVAKQNEIRTFIGAFRRLNSEQKSQATVTFADEANLSPTAPAVADVNATAGTAINVTLPPGTGGNAPLTYKVSALPTGWSFNANTRVLSGSTSIVAGTTEIIYTVTDADGDTDTATFDIIVAAADTAPTAPAVADVNATAGTAINVTLPPGTGGNAPLTYKVSALPTGWSFNANTRVLSGSTSIVAGTTEITYTVTDADDDTDTATFDIIVKAQLALADFDTTGLAMDMLALLKVSGDPGNLRVLYQDSNRGGSDTPIDGELGLGTAQTVITQLRWDTTNDVLIINDNDVPGTTDLSTYFGVGGTGRDLTFYLQTQDDGVVSFPVADNIDSVGGNFLRLTPTDAAETILDQLAKDERFIIGFGRASVAPPDQMPTAPVVADVNAVAGTATRVTLPVGTGGDGTLTYKVSALPTGWSFNANTRVLSGSTSIVAGTTEIIYTVTDADGDTDTATFDIIVAAADTAPTAPAVSDIRATVGTAIDTIILPPGTGGNAPLTYKVSALPQGFAFNIQTRALSGNPTTAGTTEITYTVTDADGDTDTATFDIIVAAEGEPLSLPGIRDFVAILGQPFSIKIPPAMGGKAPLTYAARGAPNGLVFNPLIQVLAGSPTAEGQAMVTITVTDADNNTDSQTFRITVAADTADDEDWTPWPHTGSATDALILGLKAGKRYKARIRSIRQEALPSAWVESNTVTAESDIIFRTERLYQLGNDYTTPPAIDDTAADQPTNWVPRAQVLRPTADKRYLWEITRVQVIEDGPWTAWGSADIVEFWIPPAQELVQYAYMRTNTSDAPDLPNQTEANRKNDSYLPPGWQRQIILASPTNRFVWTIARRRDNVEDDWSDWTLTNEPIGEQPNVAFRTERLYQLGNDYTTPPAIDDTAADQPTNWVPRAQVLRPTADKRYLWEITRVQVIEDGPWTAWGSADIVEFWIPPAQELVQYAYMRTNTSDAPDLPNQTEANRKNDSYLPPGWQRQIILASPTNRFVWTIARRRDNVEDDWSDWTLTNEPIGEQPNVAFRTERLYQLGNDYTTPPAIDDTAADQPTNWVPRAQVLRPTADKRYLWEITRVQVIEDGPWTAWGSADIVEFWIPPAQELVQYAYMRTNTSDAPDLPNQTEANRKNDSYLPPGWQRQIILASPTNRFVWTIARRRDNVEDDWSDWTLTNEPIGEQPALGEAAELEQYAYRRTTTSDAPDLPAQSADSHKNNNFLLPQWQRGILMATPAARFVWTIYRSRASADEDWTPWALTNDSQPIGEQPALGEAAELEQYAYRRTTTSDAPDLPAQSADSRKNNNFLLPQWQRGILMATPAARFVWTIYRSRASADEDWTPWALTNDSQPIGEQPPAPTIPQECFVALASNAGSVSDLNAGLPAEDANARQRADFLPGASFSVNPQPTTAQKPNLWRLRRNWSSNPDLITDWEYSGIVDTYTPATIQFLYE